VIASRSSTAATSPAPNYAPPPSPEPTSAEPTSDRSPPWTATHSKAPPAHPTTQRTVPAGHSTHPIPQHHNQDHPVDVRRNPAWCRAEPGGGQDPAHGAFADPVAESGEFALDAPMTPTRVFPRQPDDQIADLSGDRWTSDLLRVGPMPFDYTAVPGQQSEPSEPDCAGSSTAAASSTAVLTETGLVIKPT
jgi:hypothetical protein